MNLEKFFRDDLQIDDEFLVKALVKISQPIYLEKGALLVRQDEKQEDFLFLVSGIFRGFYLDANGKDVTDCFGVASGTPGMSVSIDNGISPISIEAATECVFIRIPGKELFPLVDTHPLLLKRYISIMQTAMQILWELKMVISQGAPLERYQWFLQKYPGLISRISNKHVASYLGMSPVTLSRIRHSLREEK